MTTTAEPVTVAAANWTRAEIATYLRVSLKVVDGLIGRKAFPSFKIGGKRLARCEDVTAYNDSLERQPQP